MHATKDAVVIVVVPSRWVFNGVVGILFFVLVICCMIRRRRQQQMMMGMEGGVSS